MQYDVFISYSRQNLDLANRVEQSLKERGLRCFMDRETIEIGEDFAEKIGVSIHASEVVLFIWTKESNQSENVAREIALAKVYDRLVVPFKLGDFVPHHRLAYYLVLANWADKNLGLNEENLEHLTDKVLKSVASARNKRLELANNLARETQTLSEQNNSQEKKKISILEGLQELKNENVQSSAIPGRLKKQYPDELRYEAEYLLGCEMFVAYKLDQSFELLLEAALADYKKSREFLRYCIESPIRCLQIKEYRFEELAERKDISDNSFAIYILGVYYLYVKNNQEKTYQCALKSMEMGSDYGKMLYLRCYEFGYGVEKNYEKILPRLRKLALEGNPMAQYIYGRNLLYGWSCEKQPSLGLKLISNGAAQGDLRCMSVLADCYLLGIEVPLDLEKAEEIFNILVQKGWVEAYADLGNLYAFNRDGSVKDIKKGHAFFTKGAELNEPSCMEWLALIYENGLNGKNSINQALRWYKKAAALGSRYAYLYLGRLYYYGCDDAYIIDNALAWKYFQKGAEHFCSWDSYYMMAQMFYDGYAPDSVTQLDAVRYLHEAVFGGGSYAGKAACKLYEIYSKGEVVPKDEEKGINYLKQAAEYENEDALLKAGEVLTSDIDSPYADEILGIKYLTKACDKGNSEAAILLAELYRNGIATIRDIEKSKEYLQIAINKDENPKALCEMGKLFAHVELPGWDEKFEDEVISNEQKQAEQRIAIEYLTRAADKKYPEAYPCLVSIALDIVYSDDVAEDVAEELSAKILDWAKAGASLDDPQSHLDLGVLYQTGTSVDVDIFMAEKCYLKATELGSAAAPNTLASLYDEFYEEFPSKMSESYYYALLAKSRGYKSSCMDLFDTHCKERALMLEKQEGGFDVEEFANLVLPRKLSFLPTQSPLYRDIQSNADIKKLVESLCEHYHDNVEFLTLHTFNDPSSDTKIVDFIDTMRLYCARLWREVKLKCKQLASVSFFDMEKTLDIAEKNVNNTTLQLAIILTVEIYMDLDDLYKTLNHRYLNNRT